MDILAHGLWSGAVYNTSKRLWWAVFFGVAPDLFSFGLFFLQMILGIVPRPDFSRAEPPDPSLVPSYIHSLYNVTHSLVIFLIVFGIIWLVRRRPFWEFGAWGLHILIDIPTHTSQFFPTPFLFPFSSFHIDGISWSAPWFMILNYASIVAIYALIIYKKRAISKTRMPE